MPRRKEGLSAAFGAAGPGELPPVGEVMGDLFEAPLQAPRHRAAAIEDDSEKKRGRPQGAKGKRSQEWYDYLSRRYSMPLERMVALQAMSPIELFRELRTMAVDLLDDVNGAFVGPVRTQPMTEDQAMTLLIRLMEIQNTAADKAMPYLHERRGMVVADDEGNDVPVLGIFAAGGTPAIGQAREVLGFDTRPRDVREENQVLIEGEAGKSSDGKSSPDAKSLNNNDETPE